MSPSSDSCESVETGLSASLGVWRENEGRQEKLWSGDPNTSSLEESSGLFPRALSASLAGLFAGGRAGTGLCRGEGEREGDRKGEGGLQVSSMCVILRLEGGGEEMNLFLNLSELSGEGDSS